MAVCATRAGSYPDGVNFYELGEVVGHAGRQKLADIGQL
jgi:hypothetical protein